MPFPWGAAIAAGGSILSSVLGGKSKKGPSLGKQKAHALDYDRRRIKALVDGAGDAGIHPLVALGAGGAGSGGFAQPVGDSWNTGDAIGQGLQAFGDLYQQDTDRREFDRREQSRYDDARFDKILEDQAQSKRDSLQEKLIEQQILESRSRTMLDMARARAVGAIGSGTPTLIDPNTGRLVVAPNAMPNLIRGRSTSAQEIEDMYGGLMGEIHGIGNYISDWWNTPGSTQYPSLPRGPGGSAIVGGPQP